MFSGLIGQAGVEDASGFIIFPLVVHTMDLVVSAIGIMSIGSKSGQKPGQPMEDPYDVIKVLLLRLAPGQNPADHKLCCCCCCCCCILTLAAIETPRWWNGI